MARVFFFFNDEMRKRERWGRPDQQSIYTNCEARGRGRGDKRLGGTRETNDDVGRKSEARENEIGGGDGETKRSTKEREKRGKEMRRMTLRKDVVDVVDFVDEYERIE